VAEREERLRNLVELRGAHPRYLAYTAIISKVANIQRPGPRRK
jgi:hypothetical protein